VVDEPDRHRVEEVLLLAPGAAGDDEPRVLEDAQVLHHAEAGHLQLRLELGQTRFMRPGLATIAREWGRIGCIGFGGPPAHIALLRQLCVERRGWIEPREFEDAIAACNLLPGPASTQL